MKKVFFLLLVLGSLCCLGQDPQMGQFFSSPLNINPALTAHINADWRFISNIRDQWIGPASPYVTGTASFDMKLFQEKIPNVNSDDGNVFGIGGMLMYDHSMSGIQKSTYGSFNISYCLKIAEGAGTHKLGIGFGSIYGRRFIDFSRLYFQDQWVGLNGFNTNLPTGETALSAMKPYFSVSAGLLYNFFTEKSNLDLGVAAFHLNKPRQTFLDDENQVLPIRQVAHANFETFINDRIFLNVNAIYQFQKKANYFSTGAALGSFVDEQRDAYITGGLWYWSNKAVIPYLGFGYKDFQLGASFDIITSKLNQATRKPKTWELSLILRGTKSPTGVIPCPWR